MSCGSLTREVGTTLSSTRIKRPSPFISPVFFKSAIRNSKCADILAVFIALTYCWISLFEVAWYQEKHVVLKYFQAGHLSDAVEDEELDDEVDIDEMLANEAEVSLRDVCFSCSWFLPARMIALQQNKHTV